MIFVIHGEDEFRVNLRVKELTQKQDFEVLESPSLNQITAKLQETGNLLFQKSSDHILIKNTAIFGNKQDEKELEFFFKSS